MSKKELLLSLLALLMLSAIAFNRISLTNTQEWTVFNTVNNLLDRQDLRVNSVQLKALFKYLKKQDKMSVNCKKLAKVENKGNKSIVFLDNDLEIKCKVGKYLYTEAFLDKLFE